MPALWTWTLVIAVAYARAGHIAVDVQVVPGYKSLATCTEAAVAVLALVESDTEQFMQTAKCIPPPEAPRSHR